MVLVNLAPPIRFLPRGQQLQLPFSKLSCSECCCEFDGIHSSSMLLFVCAVLVTCVRGRRLQSGKHAHSGAPTAAAVAKAGHLRSGLAQVCEIDPKWLVEMAPRFFKPADPHKLSRCVACWWQSSNG